MVLIDKNKLLQMLSTDNKELKARIVGRACLVLFRRQTEVEKNVNDAIVENMRGFCKSDARQGSITAKYFMKHNTLQDWMVDQWMATNVKGTPRIVKYHRQLDEAAKEKAAA